MHHWYATLRQCWRTTNLRTTVRTVANRFLPGAPRARSTKNVKKPQRQMCGLCRKAWFKIFAKQNRNIFGSVTHLILRFTIVPNRFWQTNKTKTNHINDNHMKFEVSLHFCGSGLLCGVCSLIEMTRINDYERTNICSGNAHHGAKIFLKSYLKLSFSKISSDFLQILHKLNLNSEYSDLS